MSVPGPAQRLRAELAIAQEKLARLRREVDQALVSGPLDHLRALGFVYELQGVQASIYRIRREMDRTAG